MSTRDSPGGKGGRCVRLTTYHPCSTERQEIRGLNLPGPAWAISTACCGRDLYLYRYLISVSGWLVKNKSITMHGNVNVKTNKTHTFLKNLFHLIYPRNVSNKKLFITKRSSAQAAYSISPCIFMRRLFTDTIRLIPIVSFQDKLSAINY